MADQLSLEQTPLEATSRSSKPPALVSAKKADESGEKCKERSDNGPLSPESVGEVEEGREAKRVCRSSPEQDNQEKIDFLRQKLFVLKSPPLASVGDEETKPATKPTIKPKAEEGTKPATKPTIKPKAEEETKPATKPAIKPKAEEETKPATKPAIKPKAEEETKLATKPKAEEETKPATKPKAEEETKPATKPKAEEETKSAAKPKAEEETKPVTKPKAEEIKNASESTAGESKRQFTFTPIIYGDSQPKPAPPPIKPDPPKAAIRRSPSALPPKAAIRRSPDSATVKDTSKGASVPGKTSQIKSASSTPRTSTVIPAKDLSQPARPQSVKTAKPSAAKSPDSGSVAVASSSTLKGSETVEARKSIDPAPVAETAEVPASRKTKRTEKTGVDETARKIRETEAFWQKYDAELADLERKLVEMHPGLLTAIEEESKKVAKEFGDDAAFDRELERLEKLLQGEE